MKNKYTTPDDRRLARDCGISVVQLRADRKAEDKRPRRIRRAPLVTIHDPRFPPMPHLAHIP